MKTRTPLYHRVRNDAAFTLLEVVVALALLAILLVPLTASFITAIRETSRVDQRLSQSADAQRIAAAWTKDVHTVASDGYNTPGSCVDPTGVSPPGEYTLVSFEWDSAVSANTTLKKASWVVEGSGSGATLVRRYCEAGITVDEQLIASSFGVNGMAAYDVIHGPDTTDSTTRQQFCDNLKCTIAVSGAFEYSLTVGRRVVGTGNPIITRPPAPVITGVLGGNQTLTVVWLPVTAAIGAPEVTGYRVWLSDSEGGPEIPSQVLEPSATDTVALFTGLVNGKQYWAQMQAVTAPGFDDSLPSQPPMLGIPTPVPPGPAANVAATRGDTQASITWDAVTDDGGSPITGWKVRAKLADTSALVSETPLSGATPRAATITGLTNGTPYFFTVVGINALGDGAESQGSNVVVPCGGPSAPEKPTVEDVGSVRAKVTWNSPLDNGCAITSYEIESDPPFQGDVNRPASPWTTTPVTSGEAPTEYTTPTMNGQVPYKYRVRGLNSSGIPGAWSVYSESLSSVGVPTVPPGNPTAVPQEDRVNEATNGPNINNVLLGWDPVPNTGQYNGGSPVIGYQIHVTPAPIDNQTSFFYQGAGIFGSDRLTQSYGNLKQIDDKGTPTVWDDTYIDYTFSLAAKNAVGEAVVGDQAQLQNVRAGGRPTAAPTNVQVNALSLSADRSAFRVTWDPMADTVENNGDNPLIGYLVRWKPADINGQSQIYVNGVNAGSADLGNFAKGATYDIQVVAVNDLGSAANPGKGAGLTATTITKAAPTALVAPASSAVVLTRPAGSTGNRLNLNFPAFTSSNGSAAPTYAASCTVPAEPAVAAVAFPSLTPGDNLLDSPSLTNGKAWRCTVTATATYLSGPADVASVQSSGTATPATISSPPTNVSVAGISGGKARITWTPVPLASNGGDGPASYVVDVSPSLGGFPKVVNGASSNQVDTDTAVPFGGTYTFSVSARNIAGDSAPATFAYTANQSVPVAAVTNVDYAPQGTPGSVKILWTPLTTDPGQTGNSPITKYVVTMRNLSGGVTSSFDVPGASASETTLTGFAQITGNAFNTYEVTVTPVNGIGAGPAATRSDVKTGGVPLIGVQTLTINPVPYRADGSVRINWTGIDANNPKQTGGLTNGGQSIAWSFDGGANWSSEFAVNGYNNVSSALGFSNPDQPIQIRVRTFNANGTNTITPTIVSGRLPGGPTVPGSGVTLTTAGAPGSGTLRIQFAAFGLSNDGPTHYNYALIGYSVTCDSPGFTTQTYSGLPSGISDLTGLTPGKPYTCVLTASAATYEAEPLGRKAVSVTRTATSS